MVLNKLTQNPPPSDVVPSGGVSVVVSAPSGSATTTSGVSTETSVTLRKSKPSVAKPVVRGSRSRPGKGRSVAGSDSSTAMESAEDIVVEVSNLLDSPKIELVRPSGSKFFRPGAFVASDSDSAGMSDEESADTSRTADKARLFRTRKRPAEESGSSVGSGMAKGPRKIVATPSKRGRGRPKAAVERAGLAEARRQLAAAKQAEAEAEVERQLAASEARLRARRAKVR